VDEEGRDGYSIDHLLAVCLYPPVNFISLKPKLLLAYFGRAVKFFIAPLLIAYVCPIIHDYTAFNQQWWQLQ
jgi:hypothetical protein